MIKVYMEPVQGVQLSPDAHSKLTTLLTAKANANGPGSCAGDTTLAVDGKAYTGTVLVSGANPDITFKIRSAAPVKEAPAKATKAAPVKAAKPAPTKAPAKKVKK
jgi:hypothetical protein